MAKFCGKCGSKLDETTGLCPRCDEEKIKKIIETEEAEKRKKETKKQKAENRKKKIKKIGVAILAVFGVVAIAALTVAGITILKPMLQYNSAVKYMEESDYTSAISVFEQISEYKDSKEKIDECNYLYAIDLAENEEFEEAIKIFEELGDYKDSFEYINHCYKGIYSEELFEIIENIKTKGVGDTVTFGSYEQDGNFDNGMEPIDWIVLEKENYKMILITKLAIEAMPYHDYFEDITWETCTLRTWLNGEFIESAFSETEKKILSEMNVENNDNVSFGTYGGSETVDKVKLLSIEEAKKYFSADDVRACEPSDYAKERGVYNTDNGKCIWWLRSPGCIQSAVARVLDNGNVDDIGYYVDTGIFVDEEYYDDGTYIAVRPVICIDTAKFDSALKVGNAETETEENDENGLGNPDLFTTESENWAEIYFDEMISKINYIGYENIFNTEKVKSLFVKNENLTLDDILLPGEIMSAYWYITGFEEKMGFLGKNYYSLEEIEASERLTEKDKEVLQSFFTEEDFAEKYETSVLEAAFNYFYGKNTVDIKAISNETNFYISEDGTGFYVKTFGKGGGMSNMYYRLGEVKYEGNEAVLYFNILLDDVFSGCVMDYTNGNILVETNNVNVQSFENKVAFETLCKENRLDYDDFGTAKLRIGKDGNKVYIIGWEGTVPGNW